jgi:uncharacterized membrane protein
VDISKRIYTAFLAAVAVWCLSIVAAPILHAVGSRAGESLAFILYGGFSRICHQIDSRSLHVLGQKFGVCVRCTAIYFSFFAGIGLYPLFRPLKARSLPHPAWLVLAVVPMALDAACNDLGILLSTESSRVITGSIAGFIFAFYILPTFMEAITQLLVHHTVQGDTHYAGKTQ